MPIPQPLTMTLRDLITNPPGAGTRHVAARYRVRDDLTALFRGAMADPARAARFSLRVWKPGKEETYVALAKVPSERTPADFDVVLWLDYAEGRPSTASARCRLYCNSPGWVFTYGYVAFHRGLLAPGWEDALGQAVVGDPPTTTNPGLDFGFDKVVHQGALYALGRGGMLTRNDALRLSAAGRPILPGTAGVSAEAKLKEYQRYERAESLERREAARKRKEAEREDAAAAKAAARKASADRVAGRAGSVRPSKSAPAAKKLKSATRAPRAAASAAARPRKK